MQRLNLLNGHFSNNKSSFDNSTTKIDRDKNIAELNDFVQKNIGAIKMTNHLIAVPLVIPFDDKGNPVLDNPKHKEDYDFVKDIWSDDELMLTSSLNGGRGVTGDKLHLAMRTAIRGSDDEREGDYGLYKVFDIKKNEFVGMTGSVDSKIKVPNTDKKIVDTLIFITKKYNSSGYGTALLKWSLQKNRERDDVIVWTGLIANRPTINICTNLMPSYQLGISVKNDSNGRPFGTQYYTNSAVLAGMPDFCKKMRNGETGPLSGRINKPGDERASITIDDLNKQYYTGEYAKDAPWLNKVENNKTSGRTRF